LNDVTIIECPRDAWQGLTEIIPTEKKVQYLRRLVSLGFSRIDAVSFVSPKHVPQMADSEAVMKELVTAKLPSGESPEIIGIVVNEQGLERALATGGVTTIGYPYSISAQTGRPSSAPHQGRRTPAGGLCFDGLRQSLRRALGS
jgi:hydroxymethylglutaryl-CoA lyase